MTHSTPDPATPVGNGVRLDWRGWRLEHSVADWLASMQTGTAQPLGVVLDASGHALGVLTAAERLRALRCQTPASTLLLTLMQAPAGRLPVHATLGQAADVCTAAPQPHLPVLVEDPSGCLVGWLGANDLADALQCGPSLPAPSAPRSAHSDGHDGHDGDDEDDRHLLTGAEVDGMEVESRSQGPDGGGHGGQPTALGVASHLSVRKQAQQALQDQRAHQRDRTQLRLLEQMLRGQSLPALLNQLVHDHENHFPGSLCSVLLLSPDGKHLHLGAGPSLPADYNAAIEGLEIGPQVGSCGAAAWSGQRVVVEDVRNHPHWQAYRAAAEQAGLVSCWSEPIFGRGTQVLGTFAVYHREPARPSDEALEFIEFSAHLAGVAIKHHATEDHLRASQRRLGDILAAIPDPVSVKDAQGRYTLCNPSFERSLGLDATQIVGHTDAQLLPAAAAALSQQGDAQAIRDQQACTQEEWRALPDGRQVLFETIKTPLHDEAGQRTGLLSISRDITQIKGHEARIRQLNRLYAVLSEVNEAIFHLRDRGALLHEVCRIAVQTGGFRMAWMGQYQDDHSISPITHAGYSAGYVEHVQIAPQGPRGPMGTAMDENRPVVVSDVATDPLMAPWRASALSRHYRAAAAFPIRVSGRVQAGLAVCSEQPGTFDTPHIELLARLADDLGFALEFQAAEQSRREEQAFRTMVIESVAGLFYALDSQGRVLLWNHQLETVTGRSAERIRGSLALDYFEGDDRALIERGIHNAFVSGEAQAEAALVNAQGQRIPYLFLARRVELNKQPVIVGTGVDISQRVQAELELDRHRHQLENLVEQRTAELAAANARLRQDDQRLRAMLTLSQHASTMTETELHQLGIDEAVRLTASTGGCLYLLAPDTPGGLDAHAGPIWAQTTPAAWRHRQHPDGSVAHPLIPVCAEPHPPAEGPWCGGLPQGSSTLWHAGVRIEENDHPCLLLCVAGKNQPYTEADCQTLRLLGQDLWRIIRRRCIELDLAHAKTAADAANQAKSAFLANMSHEIRTPMNAIIGFAHLLRRDPLTPRQTDHLDKLAHASQHLLQVINDILDFSKIEAHKLVLEARDFHLPGLVQRVLNLAGQPALARGVKLHLHTEDAPEWLRGDPLRLEQILLNLVSNAVKFTHEGGIAVHASRADPLHAPHTLRLTVADTGIGISPEQSRALFAPFSQADASTTRRYGGTGLGLSISKRLVELMGGHIGVDSHIGQGSTFWVEIPFLPAQQPEPATRRRVLWVQEAACMPSPQPTWLECVGSGSAALTRLEQANRNDEGYALVVLALNLPDMDGVALALRILALTLRHPPRLLLSVPDGVALPTEEARRAGVWQLRHGMPSVPELEQLLTETPALTPVPLRFDGLRVLVAEDHPVNQEVIRDLLQAVGVVVDLAADGQQAVNLAGQKRYDLILMDLQMPVLGGLAATRLIRQQPGCQQLPIVALSAEAFADTPAQCREAGMNDHLAKPVEPQQLYRSLARWRTASPSPTTASPSDPNPPTQIHLPSADGWATLAQRTGLNVAQGLRHVGGRESLYLRVLRVFVQHNAQGPQQLRQQLAADDVQGLRHSAHQLKSSLATLGAQALAQTAIELETALGRDHLPDLSAKACWRSHAQALAEGCQTLLTELASSLPA